MTALSIPLALFLGALSWTLLEYLIHRWLGHDARFRPNAFAAEHVRHHGEGNHFAPSWKKALAALAVLALVGVPATLVVGIVGSAYALGLALCYVGYEAFHRRAHTHPGSGRYGRWARRRHFWHHFGNTLRNRGVTSPVWDLVFGTFERPGVIVVPDRLKRAWLTDPETGAVRADLAEHYRLRSRADDPPGADSIP